ncbi:MAG: S-layer family protein [Desmonostoc vinosum HA7617-LM4]|nr:S-layer family protein [Desmonostoc vinosum HA7617-LM4]
MQFWQWCGSSLCWLLVCHPTIAEIIPDATLPNNSTVRTSDQVKIIEGGTLKGNNLFHSFREFSFSVLTGETTGNTAFFDHGLAVRNIITRVTGGSPSNIDGMIRTTPGSTANLFFINPSGIVFGPNASLNIGGSFLASTANSVKFADHTDFNADGSGTAPLLTVSVPLGLQFSNNSGKIINQSQGSDGTVNIIGQPAGLMVQSGATLALVGGDVSLQSGNLTVPGGRVELGSVTDGFVKLSEVDTGYALDYAGAQNLGDIDIFGGSLVDASDDGGGVVQLQARNITLADNSLVFAIAFGSKNSGNFIINATESVKVSNGSNIATVTQGTAEAGDIFVNGDTVELEGTTSDGSPSFIGSQVCRFPVECESVTGDGGNITIETRRLLLKDGAGIEASTFGAGRAGNVLVKASDSIQLIGETPNGETPSGLFAQVGREAIENPGDAGTITIATQRLTVADGAQISTAARYGGNGGNLIINATEFIRLSGVSPFATASVVDNYRSGIFVSAQPGATRNVGSLNINTGLLTVEKGARITADNFGLGQAAIANINVSRLLIQDGGEVRSGSFGEGPGGTLNINASKSVEVTGSGRIGDTLIPSVLFSRTEGTGRAGNLNITSDRFTIQNGAEVTVSSQVSGQAGNLEVTARSLKLDNQGKLIGQTASVDGGNITLNLSELLLLRRNSQISTSAGTALAGGNGGTITINAPFIVSVPSENNDITANAYTGNGGRIDITARNIFGLQPQKFNTPQSDITASSQFGFNGVVTINTPNVDPSRGLVQLSTNLIDASQQITQSCAPQQSSSFVYTGRGGIPANPTELLLADDVLVDWIKLPENSPQQNSKKEYIQPQELVASPTNKIVEAQGWVIDANGNITLVAQALTTSSVHSLRDFPMSGCLRSGE